MPVYDCGHEDCTECKREFGPNSKRKEAIANYKAREKAYSQMSSVKKNPARKRKSKRKITRVRKNPTRTQGYNAKAVDAAIASSNRAGRHIGGKERKLIHSLLQGRSARTTVTVKKNPIPLYIVRVKVTGRDTHYYFDGTRLVSLKPHAKKFSSVADAKRWGEKVYQMFPTVNSVGIIKA